MSRSLPGRDVSVLYVRPTNLSPQGGDIAGGVADINRLSRLTQARKHLTRDIVLYSSFFDL
jgi:hypothetical protein